MACTAVQAVQQAMSQVNCIADGDFRTPQLRGPSTDFHETWIALQSRAYCNNLDASRQKFLFVLE